MNKILALTLKELKVYFKSPMAYVVLFVAVSVFNVFFFVIIDENREATLRDVFKVMEFMFIFILPMLTMKTFAEEKALGTMEFLLTTPTSHSRIVLGKYLGALSFFSIIILFSFVYFPLIAIFAPIDRMAALSGYCGIWLEGAFFIAIGLMVSSWTKNEILAAIGSYVLIFSLYFIFSLTKYVGNDVLLFIRYVSTISHAENFAAGAVYFSDIVYYLSGIVMCLILTRMSIHVRD